MAEGTIPLKRFRTIILVVATTLLLWGGIGWAKQSIDQVRQKWIGKHINKLVEVHGYPDNTVKAPNGNNVYVFVKDIKKFYPVAIYQPQSERGIDIYEPSTGTYSYGISTQKDRMSFEQRLVKIKCAGYFEVDQRQLIVNIRFKGDSCPQDKG